MRSATKSSGCSSGRSSAIASSPSSATVEIVTVFEGIRAGVPISVDHHDGAFDCRHCVAAHLRHDSLDLALNLSLYGDHHTLNGDSHLIDQIGRAHV